MSEQRNLKTFGGRPQHIFVALMETPKAATAIPAEGANLLVSCQPLLLLCDLEPSGEAGSSGRETSLLG